MSKLRVWLLSPNVHLVISGLLQIAALIPAAAPFAPLLQTIGATLTGVGVILPENGVLHREDYIKLVDTISAAAKTVNKPGRQ